MREGKKGGLVSGHMPHLCHELSLLLCGLSSLSSVERKAAKVHANSI